MQKAAAAAAAAESSADAKANASANANESIDLFLLPELCPVGYSEDTFARFLPTTRENQEMLAEIDGELQQAARDLNCAIGYGTIGWKATGNTDDANDNDYDHDHDDDAIQCTIRHVVVNAQGTSVASYDKIHVCDYGDCSETRFFTPGSAPCSFTIHDWTLGFMVCADMRYPRLAQTLVQRHGVHAFLQPAAFARDCSFWTWRSFRETRAVECGSYFLANNYAGDYFGQTSFNPPWIDEQHPPKILGTEVSWIVATLDPNVLKEARTRFPFYKHAMASQSCTSCGSKETKV